MDAEAPPSISRTIFSTTLMEPKLRTRAYRQWIRPVADIRPTDNEPVDVSIAAYELGEVLVARSSCSPVRYIRDEKIIEQGDLNDRVLLRLPKVGMVKGDFGKDRKVEIKEGDIYISDLSQPMALQVGSNEHLNLMFPRRILGESARPLHGSILRREHLPCRMLTQHLLRLVDILPLLDSAHAKTVAQATLAVVRRCFQIASREHGSHLWTERIRADLLAHISTHLGDSDLNATTLQRRFKISRTQIYRLFADLGGVQHYISEKRLEAASHALRDHPEQPISGIIFQLGFSNERQFQRAFRAHYGMTASEARDR